MKNFNLSLALLCTLALSSSAHANLSQELFRCANAQGDSVALFVDNSKDSKVVPGMLLDENQGQTNPGDGKLQRTSLSGKVRIKYTSGSDLATYDFTASDGFATRLTVSLTGIVNENLKATATYREGNRTSQLECEFFR